MQSFLVRLSIPLTVLATVAVFCACEGSGSAAATPQTTGGTPQLYIRQPVESASTLPFGGDCAAGGSSSCQSGLCIHSGLAPSDHFRCSSPCAAPGDCPASSTCVDLVGTGVCVIGEAR